MLLADLELLKMKAVTLVRASGARYAGVLSGINRKKDTVCLTGLRILQRDGSHKAAPKHENVRWFEASSIKMIERINP